MDEEGALRVYLESAASRDLFYDLVGGVPLPNPAQPRSPGRAAAAAAGSLASVAGSVAREMVAAGAGPIPVAAMGAVEYAREALSTAAEVLSGEQPASDPFPRLRATLQQIAFMCGRTDSDAADAGLFSAAAHMLTEAADLCEIYPCVRHAKTARQLFCRSVLDSVRAILARVKRTPVGGAFIVPVGWCVSAENSGTMLLVFRYRGPAEGYDMALCDLSPQGQTYLEPVIGSASSEDPGECLRRAPMVARVESKRLAQGSFWAVVVCSACCASDRHTAAFLHECLLPYLTGAPPRHRSAGAPLEMTWVQRMPTGGDHSRARSALAALRFFFLCSGKTNDIAQWMAEVETRCALAKSLLSVVKHSTMERGAVEVVARAVARAATELPAAVATAHGAQLEKTVGLLLHESTHRPPARVFTARAVADITASDEAGSPVPATAANLRLGEDPAVFPNWGAFRTDLGDVDHLAGETQTSAPLIPAGVSVLPTGVDSADGCVRLLKCANETLSLLAMRPDTRSRRQRFALCCHLITRELPPPLPRRSRCVWSTPMPHATAQELLRQLHVLQRQLCSSGLSIQHSREADGARVVCASVLLAAADLLARTPSTDTTSVFRHHYGGGVGAERGGVKGPAQPYGLDCGLLGQQTESLLLLTPELHALRSLVLEYFLDTSKEAGDGHLLFRFAVPDRVLCLEDGVQTLCKQLGVALGHDATRSPVSPGRSATLLSGSEPWLLDLCPEFGILRDMRLLLKVLVSVTAETLPQPDPARQMTASDALLTWSREGAGLQVQGFGSDLVPCCRERVDEGWLMGWFGSRATPRDASMAAAGNLCVGSDPQTEDDVLGVADPPSFGGSLNEQDSEDLLTYLTAPAVRIPLVLAFFTNHDRVHALGCPEVQRVVDATLFEPGSWRHADDKVQVSSIPASDRRHLATPAGMLYRELEASPEPVLAAVQQLLVCALDKDSGSLFSHDGRTEASNAALILYVLRLASRVHSFVHFLLHSNAPIRSALRWSPQHGSVVAGKAEKIVRLTKQLERRLRVWAKSAVLKDNSSLAAKAHAGLMLCNRCTDAAAEAGIVLLCSQAYILSFHDWDDQQRVLPVGDTELFDVMEQKRSALGMLLRSQRRDEVMAAIHRTVNLYGDAAGEFSGGSRGGTTRWDPVANIPGAFMPSDAGEAEKHLVSLQPRGGESYAQWLLRTVPFPAGEVFDINDGRLLTSGKQTKSCCIPRDVLDSADFRDAIADHSSKPCNITHVTANRSVMKVGSCTIERWVPDDRPLPRMRTSVSVSDAADRELIADVIGPNATLQCIAAPRAATAEPHQAAPHEYRRYAAHTDTADGKRLVKEVVVWPQSGTVHVFSVFEHGRRVYRRQEYTSDAAFSLHAPSEQRPRCCDGEWSLEAGDVTPFSEPEPSVVITRVCDGGPSREGRQETFVPRRALLGLLPDALLEEYVFWRRNVGHGLLIGYPNPQCGADPRSWIEIRLKAVGDVSGQLGDASARISRRRTGSEDEEVLVNLLSTQSAKVAELCAKLENPSHVLCWCAADGSQLTRVEMPRVRLSFTATPAGLTCDQHAGYGILLVAPERIIMSHASGLGGACVLLRSQSDEYALLSSAVVRPVAPPGGSGPWVQSLPSQVLWRHGDETWVDAVKGARHHLFTVHESKEFLSTMTLTSALHLALSLAMRRKFAEVAQTLGGLSELSTAEERQLFAALVDRLRADTHADACALRLWLYFTAMPYGEKLPVRIDLVSDVNQYVARRSTMSARCVLSAAAERTLLRKSRDIPGAAGTTHMLDHAARTRSHVLKTMMGSPQDPDLAARIPDKSSWMTPGQTYDSDGGGVGFDTHFREYLRGLRYTLPEGGVHVEGLGAVSYICERVIGDREPLTFYEVYDIFRGSREDGITVRVDEADDATEVGCVLARVLARRSTVAARVLRALELSSGVLHQLPSLLNAAEEVREGYLGDSAVHRVESRLADLERQQQLRRSAWGKCTWPSINLKIDRLPPASTTAWARIRVPLCKSFDRRRHECPLDAGLPPISGDCPSVSATECPFVGVAQLETEVEPRADYLLPMHKALVDASSPGDEWSRLAEQIRIQLDKQKEVASVSTHGMALSDLRHALSTSRTADYLASLKLKEKCERQANPKGLWNRVAAVANRTVKLRVPELARMLMEGNSDQLLQLHNPGVEIRELWAHVVQWQLRIIRMSRAHQGVLMALDMREMRDGAALQLRARTLAAALTARVQHVQQTSDGFSVDPRLLSFEFLCGITLRKHQKELFDSLCESVETNTPVCHQMLMGQGKTTVVTPLLVLHLADSKRLVTVVVPRPLVDFTRGVLRKAFSSPIIPKPVTTFDFDRATEATEDRKQMLETARSSRAVVVAHPVSLKSLLLKMVEIHHMLETESRAPDAQGMWARMKFSVVPDRQVARAEQAAQLKRAVEMLRIFQDGAVLMDEVDLILHPLRSELNWPLGKARPIDFAHETALPEHQGLRYDLPWRLLELFRWACADEGTPLPPHVRVGRELRELRSAVAEGAERGLIQKTPHHVLLSREFYKERMVGAFAAHATSWLRRVGVGMAAGAVQEYLLNPLVASAPVEARRGAELQLLNLAAAWLQTLLPHVLSRVHRLSFGVMQEGEIALAEAISSHAPASRRLLAVPFVGKDVPSPSSEFQHPDVVIGFTITSFCLCGLRRSDFRELLRILRSRLTLEIGKAQHLRTPSNLWVKWVRQAGGRVQGYSWDGDWLNGKPDPCVAPPVREARLTHVTPLEAVSLSDEDLVEFMHGLLGKQEQVIQFFLFNHAFPETLMKSDQQLTSNAQQIAGSCLSMTRVGFSGTPNKLLPESMGRCKFADEDDGEVIRKLASPAVVSLAKAGQGVELLPQTRGLRTLARGWTPKTILTYVATRKDPSYTALIDCGALITGYSNFEAANELLDLGLPEFKGVVYLSDRDESMVLLRDGRRVLRLEQCGLAWHERFSFYDHIHTTGIDIKQPMSSVAALTISKDNVFRDYAQAAFRMRGIGNGQRIEILTPPEVAMRMRASRFWEAGGEDEYALLRLLILWLQGNAAEQEHTQLQVLSQQNLADLWRTPTFRSLQTVQVENEKGVAERLEVLLKTLPGADGRSGVDFSPPDRPMWQLQGKGIASLRSELAKFEQQRWWSSDWTAKGRGYLETLSAGFASAAGSAEQVDREIVHEQEQEKETHQEQEYEHMQRKEQMHDVHAAPDALSYSREVVRPVPWDPAILSRPQCSENPFYPLRDLDLASSVRLTGTETMPFPSCVLLSDNYYHRGWRWFTARRLKNIVMFAEWVPGELSPMAVDVGPRRVAELGERVRDVHRLYAGAGRVVLRNGLEHLARVLGAGAAAERLDSVYAAHRSEEGDEGISVNGLSRLLAEQTLFDMQQGRFFVALSMEEAEHLRGAMINEPQRFRNVSLRATPLASLMDAGTVLQPFTGGIASHAHQAKAAEACYRFTDCRSEWTREHVGWMLRCLPVTPQRRLGWWTEVRRRRRRVNTDPLMIPGLQRVFREPDELDELGAKAILRRIGLALRSGGTTAEELFDHFAARDRLGSGGEAAPGSSGEDSLSEHAFIEGVLAVIGMSRQRPRPEILRALYELAAGGGPAGDARKITPGRLRALLEQEPFDRNDEGFSLALTEAAACEELAASQVICGVEDFTLSMVPPTLEQVFFGEGLSCRRSLSIWKANGDWTGTMISSGTCHVSFGCFVGQDGVQPQGTVVEVRGSYLTKEHHMRAFIDRCFPAPVRFSRLWTYRTGASTTTIWEPAPPPGFVALGVAASASEIEPTADEVNVRCFPLDWLDVREQPAGCTPPPPSWTASNAGREVSLWQEPVFGVAACSEQLRSCSLRAPFSRQQPGTLRTNAQLPADR
eukprot:TRINITY_DN6056_c0_g2_i1.p1 TRINITY_DN6056_c0_g2~~TRINITY_DN6056_c0_g2_i1.p1  ORF type:complete len:3869 (+),score=962.49 TRINITY_DN6056_c0_g2_i1:109-11715(+)